MTTLIIGAYGQVGQQLIRALSGRIGMQNVICADLKMPPEHLGVKHHHTLNALEKDKIEEIVDIHKVKRIYCLTALLSVTGQVNPLFTHKLNMTSLFNCLEVCRQKKLERMFWPSSIAAFGITTPKDPQNKTTKQRTIMQPGTAYGITKVSGQLWCQYYYEKFGVDVRSIRYPGLVGYRSPPGGGTTDYAVEIFHSAKKGQTFSCYLKPDTYLPMIYTDDAINGTLQLMDAPSENLTIRTSYNLQGVSFCPSELAAEIQKHIPNFKIKYDIIEAKQKIAQSWPTALQDRRARRDWGWSPKFGIKEITEDILKNLKV